MKLWSFDVRSWEPNHAAPWGKKQQARQNHLYV